MLGFSDDWKHRYNLDSLLQAPRADEHTYHVVKWDFNYRQIMERQEIQEFFLGPNP